MHRRRHGGERTTVHHGCSPTATRRCSPAAASNLSQGQRQLITIARIVLANRPVLILDEATSSVDTRTERKLQEALTTMMHGRTSFVIAHRLSTIRDADVIVAIDDGRVVDVGSHDELMAKGGFYHDLYMSQFRGEATPVGL